MKSSSFNDITLTEATLNDAPIIFDAIDSHREHLRIWLPFVDKLQSWEDEEKFLSFTLSIPYKERNLVFLIKKEGSFCGLIGFTVTDNINHRTEIGYWLLPEYQGQGIMSECVKRLCYFAVKERKMNRIQIRCAIDNRPSNAIPQRLGFHLEGVERCGELFPLHKYVDLNVYSILRKEVKNL